MVDILTGQQAAKVVWSEMDHLNDAEVEAVRAIAARLLAAKETRITAKKSARHARVGGCTLRIWGYNDLG